jgi:hypothetical protein
MTFTPSIQSLVGAHSGGGSIAVDWSRSVAFELSNTNLSRYGLLTGLEENYAPLSGLGGVGTNAVSAHIGLTASGNIFLSASNSLYAGAAMHVNGTSLAMSNFIPYPAPNFGQGGMVGVTKNGAQYVVDKGVGNNIIGVLNRINEASTTAWLDDQDFTGVGGYCCAGPVGTGIAYVVSSGSVYVTLSKITFNGLGGATNVVVGNIDSADIDPGYGINYGINGICLDKTDNKIIACMHGSGGAHNGYLVKLDPTTAAVEWATPLPNTDGGGVVSSGNLFSQSDISNQRVAFYSGSPATVTIYDTSDGSVDDTYTSGLAGLSNIDGQCYNDTLGGIVLGCNFSDGAGSPTLLNSTPSSWSDGFAVLYVAAPIVPPPSPGTPGGPATSRKRAWTFTLDGHSFYVLDLGQEGTWIYDALIKEWMHWYTLDYPQWDVANGCMWGQRIVGCDLATTDVWEVTASTLNDNGAYDIPHVVTGGLLTRSRSRYGCDDLLLTASLGDLCNTGGSAMSMRFSDDYGQTWSAYFNITMAQGDYSSELRWRSLGSFGAPGRIFEFSDLGGPRSIDGCDAFLNGFDDEKET